MEPTHIQSQIAAIESQMNDLEAQIKDQGASDKVLEQFQKVMGELDTLKGAEISDQDSKRLDKVALRVKNFEKALPFDFEGLPRELQVFVASHLSPKDLGSLAQVSQSAKQLADDAVIWKEKVFADPKMRKSAASVKDPETVNWREFYRDFSPFEDKFEALIDLQKCYKQSNQNFLMGEGMDFDEIDQGIVKAKEIFDDPSLEKFGIPEVKVLIDDLFEKIRDEDPTGQKRLEYCFGQERLSKAKTSEKTYTVDKWCDQITKNKMPDLIKECQDSGGILKIKDDSGRDLVVFLLRSSRSDEDKAAVIGQGTTESRYHIINNFIDPSGDWMRGGSLHKYGLLHDLFQNGEIQVGRETISLPKKE